MKKLPVTLLVIAATFFGTQAYSQQADSLKQARLTSLSKELSITDAKAKQVVAIMDDYKTKAKNLEANTSLNQEELRLKFDALIAEKNNKLEKLLTEEQLQKVVPSSERRKDN